MINIIQLYKTSSEFNQWEIWYSYNSHSRSKTQQTPGSHVHLTTNITRCRPARRRNCFQRWQCCLTQVRNGEGSTILAGKRIVHDPISRNTQANCSRHIVWEALVSVTISPLIQCTPRPTHKIRRRLVFVLFYQTLRVARLPTFQFTEHIRISRRHVTQVPQTRPESQSF
jgi:hypothetical protein